MIFPRDPVREQLVSISKRFAMNPFPNTASSRKKNNAKTRNSSSRRQCPLQIVPSPINGIGLCQGNSSLMTDDLPSVSHFGKQEKIHFVHFRDVEESRRSSRTRFTVKGKAILWNV